jgi:hypothetical protein
VVSAMSRGPRGGAGPGRRAVRFGQAELLRDADRRGGWLLAVDGVPQSYVDLDDPSYLEFDYVRWMAEMVDLLAPAGQPLSVVHVGGAAMTLPRYVAATRPRSRQVVFEPDEELTAMVRRPLPLPRASRIRVRGVDGRAGVGGLPPRGADVVVVDAFVAGRVPAALTSGGFVAEVVRVLRPDGVYLLNVADGPPLSYARRVAAGVLAGLGEALLVAEPAVLRGRRFGNLVLAAGRGGLPVGEFTRAVAGAAFPARVVAGADLRRFVSGARPFTDADAACSPPAPENTWTLR